MSNDKILRAFGLNREGTTTSIHMYEFTDSTVGIVFVTPRDNKKPLQTGLRLNPETFALLSEAMFLAAHDSSAWKQVESSDNEEK